jgi:pentatricopeptide repeat protein
MAMYQRRYVQPSIIISSAQQNPKAAVRPAVSTLPQNGTVLSKKQKLTKGSQTAQSQTPNAVNAESELKVKPLKKRSEDARLEALRSRLREARVLKQPNIVEEVMREVRTNPVSLNAVDLSAGFEGCLAVSNLEMSTWVLSYMKSLRYMVPAEYIGLVVKRASSSDQLASLVALVKELTSTGTFRNSKQSIEEYLDTVLLAWTQNQRLKPELVHDGLQQTYDIYLNLRNEKKMNIKLSRETYTTLAIFHVGTRRGDKCLEIFQEMNRVNVEPDLESCEKVLEEAIAKMETKVVKLIVTYVFADCCCSAWAIDGS